MPRKPDDSPGAWLARWLAAGIALLALAGCGQGGQSTDELVRKAEQARADGETRSAVIQLKKALQQHPDNPEARRLLGSLYARLGQGPAAEKELRRAMELGVPRSDLWDPLVRALLQQGAFEEALRELEQVAATSGPEEARRQAFKARALLHMGRREAAGKALANARNIGPEVPRVRLEQGRLLAVRGDRPEAIRELRALVKDNPRMVPAWELYGDLLRADGALAEAADAYSKAIAQRALSGDKRYKRAMVRVALGELEKAGEDLDALARHWADHPKVAYLRGRIHFGQGSDEEAVAAFQEALNRGVELPSARFYLGVAHLRLGNFQQAVTQLQRSLRNQPDSQRARRLLAVAYFGLRDFAAAERVLKPALSRNPEDPQLLNLMGRAALARGETREGTAYLRRLAKVRPGSANARLGLGLSLMMEGERGQGLDALRKALELDPRIKLAEIVVVLAHIQDQDYDRALKVAGDMAERKPQSPYPRSLQGLAWLGKERPEKAAAAFRKALEVSPGDPVAGQGLARLALRQDNLRKAREHYQAVLDQHPDNLKTLLALARLDSRQGKGEAARKRVERAMEAHPRSPRPRILLSRHHRLAGSPSRSLSLLQEIPEAYATTPEVLEEMGRVRLALGEAAGAADAFGQLVERRPDSATAHYLLARALAGEGAPEEAYGHLKKALSLNPDSVKLRMAKVRHLMGRDRMAQAAAEVAELRKAHSGHGGILALAGDVAMRQGRPGEAAKAYREALQADSGRSVVLRLAQARWHSGAPEKGVAALESWIADHPDDSHARLSLSAALDRMGRKREARSQLETLLEREPENVAALNNLAWHLRQDQPDRALKLAKRAHDLAPEAVSVRDTLGMILLERGETFRALRLVRRAADDSASPVIQYHLARVYAAAGRKTQARSVLERVLDGDAAFPQRQEARELLAELRR